MIWLLRISRQGGLPMDTARDRFSKYAWLVYYNDYLYRSNLITHEAWKKMFSMICSKYG